MELPCPDHEPQCQDSTPNDGRVVTGRDIAEDGSDETRGAEQSRDPLSSLGAGCVQIGESTLRFRFEVRGLRGGQGFVTHKSSSSDMGRGALIPRSTTLSKNRSGRASTSETSAKSVRWVVAHTTPPEPRSKTTSFTPSSPHALALASQNLQQLGLALGLVLGSGFRLGC